MRRPALKPEIKLGAEPKKIAFLVVLVVGAIGIYFYNSSDTPQNSAGNSGVVRPAPGVPVTLPPGRPSTRTQARTSTRASSQGVQGRGITLQEFRPTLKPKDPIDPSHVDPTLRLVLLARLRNVSIEGGGRSLFDFSAAPAPKVEIPKVGRIIPGQTAMAGIIGPVLPKPPTVQPKPPPPPIPLKFYGFNTLKQGAKRAFFLEGDDIFVAGEGELIKNRYKVVRIGVNSAVVEDTTNQNQQTLPLEAEQVSS
jgi:hypothetical protein